MSLDKFSGFGRRAHKVTKMVTSEMVVAYTRVSSKEQAEKNMSLQTQQKSIQECADRNSWKILESFGGTYESAKSDGRKEFQRMLDFIKKYKGKVSRILVYSVDRFSRTGGAAIKLAQDLREKYGVIVYAVTQPSDTTNSSGVLHQNICDQCGHPFTGYILTKITKKEKKELEYGARKSSAVEKNLSALHQFTIPFDILPFDYNATVEYGIIRADQEFKGTPIGPLDTLIAAHAKSINYVLVTNNEKEFNRVNGLQVENWVK